ncbi:MAG: hypothetical protein ABR521_04715 [Gaiellaceae bacterium]
MAIQIKEVSSIRRRSYWKYGRRLSGLIRRRVRVVTAPRELAITRLNRRCGIS